MQNVNHLTKFNAFSILLLAFCWLFEASAIGPALGEIAKAFPQASLLQIQNVMTAPLWTAIVVSVIAGKLAEYFDKKAIVLIGLLIYAVTGVLPIFVTNIDQVIILRVITGIGAGLVLPMTNAMITVHYSGVDRERMFGLASSVSNIANVFVNVIVGFLITVSWKMTFYAFLFILVIFIVAALGIPKSPPQRMQERKVEVEANARKRLPKTVYFYALFVTILWMLFTVATLNCSIFLTEEKICIPWQIGIANMFPALGNILAGPVFPQIRKALKETF